jgi:RHS repeat-associated protein
MSCSIAVNPSTTLRYSFTGGYDPSGNLTADNATGNTYLYDGEGRICAVSSTPVPGFTTMTGYVYDAEGTRVAKGTITSMSCDPSVNGIATANNETDYVLGPGGEQVTELAQDANGTMNWQRSYVYAGGALIATYDPNPDAPSQPLPSFRLTDWLGTLRATTDAYGVAQGTCTGLPFGDGVTCSGDIPDNHHFTGKERDSESGNDYFPARYYASSMGRWLSPDWSAKVEPVPYAKLGNPQSLNLYSYVLNNPLSNVDLDGHACNGNDSSTCKITMTQITQTVTFRDMVKGKEVDSTVKVVTDLTTISDSKTGAVVSTYAAATATNVTSHFSSSQLATIGSTIGAIQQAGASMALGANPQQLMTAIVAKESTLGLTAPTNPLQLSGSSGFKPHPGDAAYNIQGGLNVLQERGRSSNYDPAPTYSRFNGVPDPVQRATNVAVFMGIYNGMTQSSWGYSLPSVPSAPIPAGLQ